MWQNLLSTAASQLGGLMTIAALPDEVLLLCFRLHVWCNSDTPQRLLRVCRRWYANRDRSLILMGRHLPVLWNTRFGNFWLFLVRNQLTSHGKQDRLPFNSVARRRNRTN